MRRRRAGGSRQHRCRVDVPLRIATACRVALAAAALCWPSVCCATPAGRSPRRVVVQVVDGRDTPAEVLATNDLLRKHGTRCEHMVLADPGTLRTHPWMEAALERRGVAVHPLPDPVRDMQGAGVDASKDAVAAARSLGHVRRLGALKAPTLSQGDLMVVLGLRAVPVGNIDSLFECVTILFSYFFSLPFARLCLVCRRRTWSFTSTASYFDGTAFAAALCLPPPHPRSPAPPSLPLVQLLAIPP